MLGKNAVLLILLVVSVSACSLGAYKEPIEPLSPAQATGRSVSTSVHTLTTTNTVSPTLDTAADQGTLDADTIPNTPINTAVEPVCTPKTEWPVYSVAGGDTLADIARRVNSTTAELVKANCLTDPNLLSVGQNLYVPRVASYPQAVYSQPSRNVLTNTGYITITPYVRQDSGWTVVKADGTVILTWVDAPRDVVSIDFLLAPSGTGSTYSVIGTDENPADGASISWHVPGGFTGHLTARANMHNLSTAVLTKEFQIYAE